MDPFRHWFLTWTTYGTWLPGDDRGFVSNIADAEGRGVRLNEKGSQPAESIRGLHTHSKAKLIGDPMLLIQPHAQPLLDQFLETATFRNWTVISTAIMPNHVHLLVKVPGDPDPSDVLGDFKSYASRRLNKLFGKPPAGTWWTEGGSKRKKGSDEAIAAAVEYTMHQSNALLKYQRPGERGA